MRERPAWDAIFRKIDEADFSDFESRPDPLSEQDSLTVVNMLENPPAPNARLRAAIAQLPKPAR